MPTAMVNLNIFIFYLIIIDPFMCWTDFSFQTQIQNYYWSNFVLFVKKKEFLAPAQNIPTAAVNVSASLGWTWWLISLLVLGLGLQIFILTTDAP